MTNVESEFLISESPEALQQVDIVQARFSLEFLSSCRLRPADFLGVGRRLQFAGRHNALVSDSERIGSGDFFKQQPSDDPVARRKFQKPAPSFVVTIPIRRDHLFEIADQLDIEVLFIGSGILGVDVFLRRLMQLGPLGLVAGQGRFDVVAVHSRQADRAEILAWQQGDPTASLACVVQSMGWLLQQLRLPHRPVLEFMTPTRLLVDGKPLRRPRFAKIFPFMLRRVTAMLHAHCGVEVIDDPLPLLERARTLEVSEVDLRWQDWRCLERGQGLAVGGFVGSMQLSGECLYELGWVFAVASLLGLGKGAAYGAGRFSIRGRDRLPVFNNLL